MYNDYKLIDEEKLFEMQRAYSDKLRYKVLLMENSKNCYENLHNILLTSKQILISQINNSKNLEIQTAFKEVLQNIDKNIERIDGILEISTYEENKGYDYEYNLHSLIDVLIGFLQELFELIVIESSMKMLAVLREIFRDILEDIKMLNKLNINNLRIFSLFRKKRKS